MLNNKALFITNVRILNYSQNKSLIYFVLILIALFAGRRVRHVTVFWSGFLPPLYKHEAVVTREPLNADNDSFTFFAASRTLSYPFLNPSATSLTLG